MFYCPSCGAAAARGLNYCKRCGARLSGLKDDETGSPSGTYIESLIWAIVVVLTAGIGGTIGLMAVMKRVLELDSGVVLGFTALCFLLILVVESVFVWLLLAPKMRARVREKEREAEETARLAERAVKELGPAQAAPVSAPASSVTEHTTHTFEPVRSEAEPKPTTVQ